MIACREYDIGVARNGAKPLQFGKEIINVQ
jgi:hypothetical protein